MYTETDRRMLALFADNVPHSYFETIQLGCTLLRISQRRFEGIFRKRLLFCRWVRRLYTANDPRLDMYQLTEKGDEYFRAIQISRLAQHSFSDEQIRHYKMFNRQSTGKYGAEGMADSTITEKSANLREKYPHLYE